MSDEYHELLEAARQRWKLNPRLCDACESMVTYLLERDEVLHITLASAKKLLGCDYTDEEVFLVLWSLSSPPLNLLKASYEFIDENDAHHSVSPGELLEAEEKQSFPHPESGELITNFEEFIYLNFESNLSEVRN